MLRQVSSVVVLLGLTASPAFADDPKFTFGKAEEVKDVKAPEWKAAAEAGVVFTAGNSETTTLTGGFKVSRKAGDNKFALEGAATYARSAARVLIDSNGNGTIDNSSEITSVETTTAQNLSSKARYDRFLTTSNSLFIAALASRDVPAGKESTLGGQLGYSRQLHKTEATEVVAEVGYDFAYEDPTTGPSFAIHSARAFFGLKSAMTEGTNLDATLEALTNLNTENIVTTDDMGNVNDGGPLKDTRVNFHVGVSAKIGKSLAFQTALDVRYDNLPSPLAVKPLAVGFVPEAASIDTIMKASLIYTFF